MLSKVLIDLVKALIHSGQQIMVALVGMVKTLFHPLDELVELIPADECFRHPLLLPFSTMDDTRLYCTVIVYKIKSYPTVTTNTIRSSGSLFVAI